MRSRIRGPENEGKVRIFASLIEAVAKGKGAEEGMWTDRLLSIENACGSQGDDQIKGDVGTNKIGGNAGKDTLVGGAGFDWLEPEAATNGLKVDLSQGKVLDDGFGGTDTVSGIEGVIGSKYGDLITGDMRANRFWGHEGNDTIDGGVGPDEAYYAGVRANYQIEPQGAGKVKSIRREGSYAISCAT